MEQMCVDAPRFPRGQSRLLHITMHWIVGAVFSQRSNILLGNKCIYRVPSGNQGANTEFYGEV